MSDTLSDDLNLVSDPETASKKPDDRDEHNKSSHVAFFLLIGILMKGTAGWKDLRRSRLKPEQTAAGCFYPLVALASVCRFADWFYHPEFNLSATLISAASIFASFFFSYFAVQVVCRWLFPLVAKSKTETPYFKLLVQYALSSLALFLIPAEVLPILETLTVFLPIWTAFIITKGMRFLRLPDQYHNRCMVTIVVTVILMPYIFMWVCERIF
ncbi:MAG: hypothetical protein K2L11_05950 [Muribaculaceae bacterium]|nr:hypothetical protein [Muribaculaceae bacterium]